MWMIIYLEVMDIGTSNQLFINIKVMIIDKEERNETGRWKITRINDLRLRNFKNKEGKGNYTEIL